MKAAMTILFLLLTFTYIFAIKETHKNHGPHGSTNPFKYTLLMMALTAGEVVGIIILIQELRG